MGHSHDGRELFSPVDPEVRSWQGPGFLRGEYKWLGLASWEGREVSLPGIPASLAFWKATVLPGGFYASRIKRGHLLQMSTTEKVWRASWNGSLLVWVFVPKWTSHPVGSNSLRAKSTKVGLRESWGQILLQHSLAMWPWTSFLLLAMH
jgi:hypothetical protein